MKWKGIYQTNTKTKSLEGLEHTASNATPIRREEIVISYLQQCPLDLKADRMIHIAAENAHMATIGLLINGGESVDSLSANGSTPLHFAISAQNRKTINYLLNNHAKVNIANDSQLTPLHCAALCNDVRSTRRMLNINSAAEFINAKNIDGFTALHTAINATNFELIELLVTKGANVNIANNEGFTPLHIAASGGNKRIVRYLLQNGANPILKTNTGHTAGDIARHLGFENIIQWLLTSEEIPTSETSIESDSEIDIEEISDDNQFVLEELTPLFNSQELALTLEAARVPSPGPNPILASLGITSLRSSLELSLSAQQDGQNSLSSIDFGKIPPLFDFSESNKETSKKRRLYGEFHEL